MGPLLPLPAGGLSQQCAGTRSTFREEANRRQSVVPIGGLGDADDRWVRGHEHDPQRADEMVAQRRHWWSGALHREGIRHRWIDSSSTSLTWSALELYLRQIQHHTMLICFSATGH